MVDPPPAGDPDPAGNPHRTGHPDLSSDPTRAAALCRTAHARLMATATQLDDATVRAPSALAGWSIGHVLTHVARNADGHARRLAGTLERVDVPRYPGGRAQREQEIQAGAGRDAATLVADLRDSQGALEEVMARCQDAGWPGRSTLFAADAYPAGACPAHRLREIEVHHVDLGLGYQPSDWPEEYVAWDLATMIATLPSRLHDPTARAGVLAWLAGRGEWPAGATLDPL